MIHTTHSRKDLLDIIDIYQLGDSKYLYNYEDMTKQILSQLLWKTLSDKRRKITPKGDRYFFFEGINDIKQYLIVPSPNRAITGKLLLDIQQKVKNIIYYCTKCGYLVSLSNYETLDDILKEAEELRHYGNIPAVRRSINLLNNDVKIKDNFEVIMSTKTKKILEKKEQLKKETTPHFKVKRGPCVIVFE